MGLFRSFFSAKAPSETPAPVKSAPAARLVPPLPKDEPERLNAIYQLKLLNTFPEERFDRLTRLAAISLKTPVVLLSLLDGKREWFKSVYGLTGLREIPREQSFAAHAIASEEAQFIVHDATRDERFAEHPLIQDRTAWKFFAGHVLCSPNGKRVGLLSVLGPEVREFSAEEARALADIALLAEQEMRGLSLRNTLDRLAQAERRAEEEGARFGAFMDNLPNVAFIKDAEARTIFANPSHAKLFGVRLEDVQGKRDDEWLPAETASETMAADREVVESGKTLRIEEEIPTVLGKRHWLTFKFPIPTPTGERHLGGIAVDLTVQKEAEQRLKELLALQNALVNSANVAIVSTDQHGLIRTFNAAAERMLGYSADEVVNTGRPEIWHDPEELQRLAASIKAEYGETVPPNGAVLRWGLRWGQVAEHELTHIRKDGSKFHGALAITALRAGQETTGYMGVIQDITARHETEEAQRIAREEAEAANHAKSQFVANMSHEIRTPLNGILGVTGMLLDTELSPAQRHLADLVLSSGQGLLSIINDLLDFSKIEAGRMELETLDFALPEFLQSLAELQSARAAERKLAIDLRIAPEVPERLHSDPVRLRQVLNNLLGNAVKFSENGTIEVAVQTVSDEGQERLFFSVRDCGIGIASNKLGDIFEPFTQADVTTTRLFGGTGLGLSICRQLVELLGGRIGVQSELGAGSEFWFTIPLLAASAPAAGSDTTPEALSPLTGLHVLVAEDSSINRLVTSHQLEKLGCYIQVVENGEQAVQATEIQHFDLILMDCQMPVMDGYQATAQIRRLETSHDHYTRIIAITANVLGGERERCLTAGMDGYLTKPFQPADLHRAILEVMQSTENTFVACAPNRAPLDAETLAELRAESGEDGSGFFTQYLTHFAEDLTAAEHDLQSATAEQDVDKIARIAHRLRGAAAIFGARPLAELCHHLEQSCEEEDFAVVEPVIASLVEELTRAIDAVQNTLRS